MKSPISNLKFCYSPLCCLPFAIRYLAIRYWTSAIPLSLNPLMKSQISNLKSLIAPLPMPTPRAATSSAPPSAKNLNLNLNLLVKSQISNLKFFYPAIGYWLFPFTFHVSRFTHSSRRSLPKAHHLFTPHALPTRLHLSLFAPFQMPFRQ